MKSVIVGLFLLAVTAQAADLKVTVVSVPDGATVTIGNRPIPSPALFTYPLPKKWTECVTFQSSSQWISGAQATSIHTACPKNGKDQIFYVQRPANIAKVEVDLQYAAQLQQAASARQAAAIRIMEAKAEARKANAVPLLPAPPSIKLSTPAPAPVVNCTSQTNGAITNTRCQ